MSILSSVILLQQLNTLDKTSNTQQLRHQLDLLLKFLNHSHLHDLSLNLKSTVGYGIYQLTIKKRVSMMDLLIHHKSNYNIHSVILYWDNEHMYSRTAYFHVCSLYKLVHLKLVPIVSLWAVRYNELICTSFK
jgi:hypothetical protein